MLSKKEIKEINQKLKDANLDIDYNNYLNERSTIIFKQTSESDNNEWDVFCAFLEILELEKDKNKMKFNKKNWLSLCNKVFNLYYVKDKNIIDREFSIPSSYELYVNNYRYETIDEYIERKLSDIETEKTQEQCEKNINSILTLTKDFTHIQFSNLIHNLYDQQEFKRTKNLK